MLPFLVVYIQNKAGPGCFAKVFPEWFIGFFPPAGIHAAVPPGIARGGDPVMVVSRSVFGHFLPVLLVNSFFGRLRARGRNAFWMLGLVSLKGMHRLTSHRALFTTLFYPWIGLRVIIATVKWFGMETCLFHRPALMGILLYVITMTVFTDAGLNFIPGVRRGNRRAPHHAAPRFLGWGRLPGVRGCFLQKWPC